MFHPNSPLDSDDSQQCRGEPWQKARRTLLSTVLSRRKTCHCCHSIVQLLEDRLKDQDIILKSLPELGAADAELVVGYRNEPALRPDLPRWELTRLEIALKLPKPVVEALRIKFAVSSHLDDFGPNVFIVLQSADNGGETMEGSMKYREDFGSWNGGEELGIGVASELLGEGRLRPGVFSARVVRYWREFCEKKHEVHRSSPCWKKQETSFVDRVLGLEASDAERVLGIRVIDVQTKCIINYDSN